MPSPMFDSQPAIARDDSNTANESIVSVHRQSESSQQLIQRLNSHIDATLKPLIPSGSRCVLLRCPSYYNAGDPAIWLGTSAWLRKQRVNVLRRIVSYRIPNECWLGTLRSMLGSDGILCLGGGGDVGDMYPFSQEFRETIIRQFPHHTIIQLPQSLCFKDDRSVLRAKRAFESHPRFYLLVREKQSLARARDAFDIPTLLCPDMAFALWPRPACSSPTVNQLGLLRTDQESSQSHWNLQTQKLCRDWVDVKRPAVFLAHQRVFDYWSEHPNTLSFLQGPLARTYDYVSSRYVDSALRWLSQGRVIITDRLHGHILSLLMGIPHIVLDNSYGKVKSFYDSWTKSCSLVQWASSIEEALVLARAYKFP